jgi:hypothetical protein
MRQRSCIGRTEASPTATCDAAAVDPTPGTDKVLAETGYFYPEPYWWGDDSDWIKSLLLFFDKVAILLPDYMYGRHEAADPGVAGALEAQGLLEILHPEEFVDREMTDALVGTVRTMLAAGSFDELPEAGHFQALSRSRMGWNANVELSSELIEELVERRLAKPSQDGLSVPLHPELRTFVLVLLSQMARGAGRKRGLDLHPITPNKDLINEMVRMLRLGATQPSQGEVVAFDLETVGFNLEGISLQDVLDFKGEHGPLFQTYARSVRKAVAELSAVDPFDRARLLADRRDELGEQAETLRKVSRKRWRTPLARLGLGCAGAGASLATGNVPGAVVAGIGGLLGARPEAKPDSVYSYLFAAERRLAT